MVYKFFDNKIRTGISVNEQLAEQLHKTVIKKFKRRKVYARFKDSILVVDFAEIESLSSKNKSTKYLLCAIDLFTKYAWVKPLTDRKRKIVLNNFTEIVNVTSIDTTDLAAKKYFIVLKDEVDKLGINKLPNVPSGLNNLKTKVDDLDVGKLKTAPADLKKVSDVIDKKNNRYKRFSDYNSFGYKNQ